MLFRTLILSALAMVQAPILIAQSSVQSKLRPEMLVTTACWPKA